MARESLASIEQEIACDKGRPQGECCLPCLSVCQGTNAACRLPCPPLALLGESKTPTTKVGACQAPLQKLTKDPGRSKTPSVSAAVGRCGALAAMLVRGLRGVPVGGIALPGVAPGRVWALVVVAVAVLNAVVAPHASAPAPDAKANQ